MTVRFSPTSATDYNQNVTFTGGAGATRAVTGTGGGPTVNAKLIWQLSSGQVYCWLMNSNGTAKSKFYISNATTTWKMRCAGW